MKYTYIMIVMLLVALGCGQQSPGPAKPSIPNADKGTVPAPNNALALPKWTPADQGKGYLHKESGVGFVYPEGWEVLPAKSHGVITQLGLRKEAVEVTLYWTALEPGQDPAAIGPQELAALRPLYGDKVTGPESVAIGEQPWKKLAIAGGPLGTDAPELSGVVYVFATRRNQQAWKIKVRATVRGAEKLKAVEDLLKNYRQI